MKPPKLGLLTLFFTFLILLTCLNASAATITVPAGSSVSQINKAINTASQNHDTVYLQAGTYKITSPIVLKSNMILKGAGDGTIIYATGSVCNSGKAEGYITGTSISNAEVCNLQFKSSAAGTKDGGHGDYRNCVRLRSTSNVRIHDILFQNYLYCDGVRDSGSSNLQVYNCRIRAGHDGVCFFKTKKSKIFNNDIQIRTNTGTRIDGASTIDIFRNTYYGLYNSGWCCIECESGGLSGINIYNNIFHDYRGSSGSAAVQPVHASGSVAVFNNVLWNVGGIKFGTSKNNIINPSQKTVSYWVGRGYGSTLSR